jgi:hypothetical protein
MGTPFTLSPKISQNSLPFVPLLPKVADAPPPPPSLTSKYTTNPSSFLPSPPVSPRGANPQPLGLWGWEEGAYKMMEMGRNLH